jgi:hypothetical protein
LTRVTIRSLPRALVLLRRIADALDRLSPVPSAAPRRRVEFSIATDADFTRGYADRDRNADSDAAAATDANTAEDR